LLYSPPHAPSQPLFLSQCAPNIRMFDYGRSSTFSSWVVNPGRPSTLCAFRRFPQSVKAIFKSCSLGRCSVLRASLAGPGEGARHLPAIVLTCTERPNSTFGLLQDPFLCSHPLHVPLSPGCWWSVFRVLIWSGAGCLCLNFSLLSQHSVKKIRFARCDCSQAPIPPWQAVSFGMSF